jgi:hypothetical protein
MQKRLAVVLQSGLRSRCAFPWPPSAFSVLLHPRFAPHEPSMQLDLCTFCLRLSCQCGAPSGAFAGPSVPVLLQRFVVAHVPCMQSAFLVPDLPASIRCATPLAPSPS